jgi:hypothetical protein
MSRMPSLSLITVKLTNKIRLFRTFEILSERAHYVSTEPAYEREVSEGSGREKVKC